MMAHFEARLENCGFSPDFERRAIDAIKPCVRDDAIAQLRSYYKNQKQIAFKLIFEARDKTGPERVDCSLDSEKDWLRRVSKDLDDQVRKLDRMCRACRICRD
jgi:hypothetical protein